MKLLFHWGVFLILGMAATIPYARSQTIISTTLYPSCPTSNDTIAVIVQSFLPNSGCWLQDSAVTVAGNDVLVDLYYCMGVLTATCPRTDTIWLGTLGNGTFEIRFQAYGSGDCLSFTQADKDSLEITIQNTLNLTYTTFDALCYGDNTGSINLEVCGGTPGYSYSWSNGDTTQDISTLTAGTYTVTVTDSAGNSGSISATIQEWPEIRVTPVISGGNCHNPLFDVDFQITGGRTPYFIYFNGQLTTPPATGLSPGVYDLIIVDGNGCVDSNLVTLTAGSNSPEISSTVSNITCNSASDGRIDVTVNGGVVNCPLK